MIRLDKLVRFSLASLALPPLFALILAIPTPALASGGGGGKEGGGNLLVLEPFLMNLADPGGKRYLKLAVTVEVKDPKQKTEITDRLPIVREAIILELSTKSTKQVETTPGKNKLKNEIRQLLAQRCGLPEKDLTVFFTDFVIQFVN